MSIFCDAKQTHGSYGAAKAAVRCSEKRALSNREVKTMKLSVYRCEHCERWHLMHETPTSDDAAASEKVMRKGELGLEKYCTACHDWWPADREFWHSNTLHSTGLAQWCKACVSERRSR